MSHSSHKWIKVWTTILTDPDLDNLSLDNLGRWCKLLLYVKMHGENGDLKMSEPARTFCNHMQVDSLRQFIDIAKLLPNIDVYCNGENGVTHFLIKKWSKYQIDDSHERVLKYRESVTPQEKRRKDKEKNKKREEKNTRTQFLLPEFIDANLWNDFIEMRKKNRKPMTQRAMELAIKDLYRLKESGNDSNQVIEQSILNGWAGFYEIKKSKKEAYI